MKMEGIAVIPNQVDILCGVGHEAAHHAGNVSFRQTVAEHFDEYFEAVSKKSKMLVSKAIQHKIQETGARFLKKDTTSSTSHAYWYVADFKVGRDKISHVLRDMKNLRELESGQAQPASPQDHNSGGSKLGRPRQQVLRHQPLATALRQQQHHVAATRAVFLHQQKAITQQKQAKAVPHPQRSIETAASVLPQQQTTALPHSLQPTAIAAAVSYQQQATLHHQVAVIPHAQQPTTAPAAAAYPAFAAPITSQSDPRYLFRPEQRDPSGTNQPPAHRARPSKITRTNAPDTIKGHHIIQDRPAADYSGATASLVQDPATSRQQLLQDPATSRQQLQPKIDHSGSSDETMLSSFDEKSFSGVFPDSGNASSSNGISLHGISSHGASSHGVSSHENTSHENASNGNASNGNASNGNASNGISSHSNASNGNASNGISSHSNASNDNASNDISSNDISSSVNAPNGNASNGIYPNGLSSSGNASNGNVSSDERNARASDDSGNSQHPNTSTDSGSNMDFLPSEDNQKAGK